MLIDPKAALDGGPAGYPVLGLRVSLLDGAFHEKDSSGLAFEHATREAFRIGFERAMQRAYRWLGVLSTMASYRL